MTKKKQTTATAPAALTSTAEMHATVLDIVSGQIDRDTLIARRDADIAAVRELHDPTITALDEQIKAYLERVEKYAFLHPELFNGTRSLTTEGGHKIGWRLGQPKLVTQRKLTWAAVQERLIALGGNLAERFIRTKKEPNKDALLAAKDETGLLASLGLKVDQTESFYLDPNRDNAERIKN
jgi:phage host-nuclease inhibitor protein Gam